VGRSLVALPTSEEQRRHGSGEIERPEIYVSCSDSCLSISVVERSECFKKPPPRNGVAISIGTVDRSFKALQIENRFSVAGNSLCKPVYLHVLNLRKKFSNYGNSCWLIWFTTKWHRRQIG
jgi:hypothetical protein